MPLKHTDDRMHNRGQSEIAAPFPSRGKVHSVKPTSYKLL